jgi:hypothetical protein
MAKLLLILAGVVLLVLFVVLEGWRQQRSLERRGIQRGGRPSLIGTGMLELQSMLEPDRKVEVIRADLRERDRQHPEHRAARAADDDPSEGRV